MASRNRISTMFIWGDKVEELKEMGSIISVSEKIDNSQKGGRISKDALKLLRRIFKSTSFLSASKSQPSHLPRISVLSAAEIRAGATIIHVQALDLDGSVTQPQQNIETPTQGKKKKRFSLPLLNHRSHSRHSSASTMGKQRSKHDSKFSSISSFHTAHTSPPTPSPPTISRPTTAPSHILRLSPSSFQTLQQHLRRLQRRLKQQEYLASRFSTNLAHLLARKERNIEWSRTLGLHIRDGLLEIMGALKQVAGKSLVRKSALLQRDIGLILQLQQILHLEIGGAGKGKGIEEKEYCALELDIPEWKEKLDILLDDLRLQRKLDEVLRQGICEPVVDGTIPASQKERVAMRRFVGFVENSLVGLEAVYQRVGGNLKGVEGVLERNRKEER